MFSLLIAGNETAWEDVEIEFDVGRFLEHTEEQIADEYGQRVDGTFRARFLSTVESFPALVGFEKSTGGDFEVAHIQNLRQDGPVLRFSLDYLGPTLSWAEVEAASGFFKLGRWEESRTHWALKNGDLPAYLERIGKSLGRPISPEPPMPREYFPICAEIVGEWTHGQIDRLLMQLDVPELDVPRSLGSTNDRANAIAKFASEFPDVLALHDRRLDNVLFERARDSPSPEDAPDRFAGAAKGVQPPMLVKTRDDAPGTISPAPMATSRVAIAASVPGLPAPAPRVFVVHGRDDVFKTEVENFLPKIGTEPVILHEQPNGGRHLLTKFMEEAKSCRAAVVLMAEEDVGRHRDDSLLKDRARQNVVLELG